MDDDGEAASAVACASEDADIKAYERDMEAEVKVFPHVGDEESLQSLREQYASNPGFLPKIEGLGRTFRALRRTRPDGNCFYRAFLFGIFQQLPGNKEKQDFLLARAEQALDFCVSAGYQRFTVELFAEDFVEAVKSLCADDATVKTAEAIFQENDGYVVWWSRCITSAFLKKHAEEYTAFLSSHPSIAEFCEKEVDPMNTEADHLQIIGLSSFFEVENRTVTSRQFCQ
eukprot:TRINITY_DN810_c0_g2_i3.p1 TRINITY_DN810_c0_g2~~TRINITY_DN810_c0_g2_i3.p1  ORF type:complete len:254 (-),score=59.98 TRINITY_DN810_c0_g2_i3:221-907(-)